MKVKTSELTGAALDWAVAKCEEYKPHAAAALVIMGAYTPSSNWAQCGPIIERERITLRFWANQIFVSAYGTEVAEWYSGTTPLIAAMRCYVASKLGNEVDIPKELLK